MPFSRKSFVSLAKLTNDFLENGISYKKQDHTKATYFKRRKPEESELTIDEISNQTSEYLFNKIRMLGDPYPNAFIKTKDGKKILIKLASLIKIFFPSLVFMNALG